MAGDKTVFREIAGERKFSAKRFFLQWEWMLVLVFLVINVFNILSSPYYLDFNNIMAAIQEFLDKAILVFPMMLIILMGDIDISVGSTIALTGVIMGMLSTAGVPMGIAILIGLAAGALCGFVNGIIIAKFKELPAMIVTLSTMIIYRGIAMMLLEDKAVTTYPEWYSFFGWGQIGSIPFILIFFLVEAAGFAYLIHKTKYGRRVYALGNNPVASKFSGVEVDKIKIMNYTILGVFAAVAAVFLTSKMGSARPSIAKGYELDIIAMVVLGGVSTAGGKGKVTGVVLAAFTIGLLRYGLGVINVPSQTIIIIIGMLLIIAVALPNVREYLSEFKIVKALTKK